MSYSKSINMKKYFVLIITSISLTLTIIACKKDAQVVNVNSNNISSTALLPLTVGNKWYYQDSTFDTTTYAIKSDLTDSVVVINNTVTVQGDPYWAVVESDSTGCFGYWGYFTNYAESNNLFDIIGLDSSYNRYLFWGGSSSDGYQLLKTYTGYTSLSCAFIQNTYGFVTNYNVNGYTCQKNLIQVQDCKGTTSYVTYVSAGVGVVRYEMWQQNNGGTKSAILYSQTLTRFVHK